MAINNKCGGAVTKVSGGGTINTKDERVVEHNKDRQCRTVQYRTVRYRMVNSKKYEVEKVPGCDCAEPKPAPMSTGTQQRKRLGDIQASPDSAHGSRSFSSKIWVVFHPRAGRQRVLCRFEDVDTTVRY